MIDNVVMHQNHIRHMNYVNLFLINVQLMEKDVKNLLNVLIINILLVVLQEQMAIVR